MSNRRGQRHPTVAPYLWPTNRLRLYQVSPYSEFDDEVWRLDSAVAGRTTGSINWSLGVPVEIWNSRIFGRMIGDAKRILLANIIEKAPRNLTTVEHGRLLRKLTIWMYQRGYYSFSQLGEQGRTEYFNYICGQYLDEFRNVTVTDNTIDLNMYVMTLLFRYHGHFESVPRIRIADRPANTFEWSGAGRKIGAKSKDSIPSVPEDVFNPLMSEALRWVDGYSKDIIDLFEIEEEAASFCIGWNSKNYAYHINKQLVGFEFSKIEGENLPWRSPLQALEDVVRRNEYGNYTRRLGPLFVLRRMINCLLAACSIVIQGFVGMRVSELLSLPAGADNCEGFPFCVSLQPSVDGLNDVFFVKGQIYKGSTAEAGREGEWVVGIRPVGSDFIPEAVRALKVVQRIRALWAHLGNVPSLFVYPFTRGVGMPRKRDSVAQMLSGRIRLLQKKFLEDCVSVPAKYEGWSLTTHQFRKKFAQDIVRCDPDSMPAIREHFKHLSMHMLETGYLGNDAEMLGAIEEVALRDATAQIMAIIDGEELAGKMPDAIRKHSADLNKIIPPEMDPQERFNSKRDFPCALTAALGLGRLH